MLALRELRHRVKPGLILDVGCGMKPYESLLNTSGSKYYGTDYPITMEGSYGDSTGPTFFQTAWCYHSARAHLTLSLARKCSSTCANRRWLFTRCRAYEADGILILSAPMTWPLHEEPYDFYRYTLQYQAPLEEADFEILDEVRRGNNLTTLAQMFLDTQLANIGQALPQRVYSTLLSLVVNQACSVGNLFKPVRRLCLGCGDVPRKNVRRGISDDIKQFN